MRLNITMKDEIVEKVDEVARQMGVSRSAFLAFAATKMMKENKMVEIMPELVEHLLEESNYGSNYARPQY